MSPAGTAPEGAGVRCFVYAPSGRAGAPWLLGVLEDGADGHPELPHARVPDGAGPDEAALHAVRTPSGPQPHLVAVPVPALVPDGAGAACWWVRAPHEGPYATEYEYVMTLPGVPAAGLTWLDPAVARLRAPRDENLALAAALGAVMDRVLAQETAPEVTRAMTLGHSRREVGCPRTVPQW